MLNQQPKHWLNFIGGAWVDSDRRIEVRDPSTDQVFATIASAGSEHVEQAMAAARRTVQQGALTRQRPAERAELLHRIGGEIRKLAEEGAEVASRENGKSVNDARDEFLESARYFEYYAGMADKIEGKSIPLGEDYIDFTCYEPQGVSVQIVPWNFPVSICARSLAPALAAGNAVVVKSPELSPLAITLLAVACERAGLPAGALSVLAGPGREIGAALVAHQDTNQIVFTGSVPTGQAIMRSAAERAVPCVMELGGKSAAVAFADADLDQLMASVQGGIFFNAGQVCSAMSRLLVQREIYDEVVGRVAELAQGLSIGGGRDNPDLTPVVSMQQRDGILSMCRDAEADGARLVTGGYPVDGLPGAFVQPTVFADVTPQMRLFCEEVFGPVIAITPFDSEAEAFELANGTDYGLVAGVFTRDLSRALRAAQVLEAGQVFVNEWFAGGIETPFGGNRLSGYGREKGQEALYSYVRTKNVAIRVSR
ncbi:aldehyde dehydrogenase family protein [Marinobacter xestospongiae]|uniref:Aldehyde dehydrogenase family protein n=1 Tax=Marinobacter xestospongiae TaxID=994319 RepID=A0ABU3VZN8_9GAMM|nr:aldehyde dehydrogenase family protein [Marinobacter xestospongiae]MDV2079191.1 aldehyde dehydrogenase family protein [Marinobacter xestospongiae]